MRTQKQKDYHNLWMKNWRKNNPTKARIKSAEYAKLYKERHPEKVRKIVALSVKKWREKNPEKNKAHKIVFCAVRNGTLLKKPCRDCGSLKVEAHHKDYSKPLEVEWLCKIHHVLADKSTD